MRTWFFPFLMWMGVGGRIQALSSVHGVLVNTSLDNPV